MLQYVQKANLDQMADDHYTTVRHKYSNTGQSCQLLSPAQEWNLRRACYKYILYVLIIPSQ